MKYKSLNTEWRVGYLKYFDIVKGFGFADCWYDGQDSFVHISKVDTEPIDDADYKRVNCQIKSCQTPIIFKK